MEITDRAWQGREGEVHYVRSAWGGHRAQPGDDAPRAPGVAVGCCLGSSTAQGGEGECRERPVFHHELAAR